MPGEEDGNSPSEEEESTSSEPRRPGEEDGQILMSDFQDLTE